VVGNQEPPIPLAYKNVGGLHHGVFEAIGKGGGNVLGTRNPTHIAFDAHPHTAQGDAYAFRTREKAGPTLVHFIPPEEQVPTGVYTRHSVIVRPHSFHFGEVQVDGSSLRGGAVHRAARLCGAARADTILASREALEASGRPPVGLQKVALKGIAEPVEAAEVRWEG